jgi:ABC-type sugar transport system ATPase subunit
MENVILDIRAVSKRFPGVQALSKVTFQIQKGQCHALVGENGAGKTTLGKIIAGIYQPDEGAIFVDGKECQFKNPREAMLAGIGIVHQELALCENMTVAENLCLSNLPHKFSFLRSKELRKIARSALERIGVEIDVSKMVAELSISQQQLIQIAAAVSGGAKLLIFDEPTSSLSQKEVENLFGLIERLKFEGITSVYVSHRMSEIFRIADKISVLRDGELVETCDRSAITNDELIFMMIGRSFKKFFPEHSRKISEKNVIKLNKLSSSGKFKNISFAIRSGEIVGLAGLIGAGRTEIAEAIFALDSSISGEVAFKGKNVSFKHPCEAIQAGIGLVPEDRKRHGLILSMNCRENITIGILKKLSSFSVILRRKERELCSDYFKKLSIKPPDTETISAALSGGNQQKLVIARWLAANCSLLILDEPTRGVDVGAKMEIHLLMDELASSGVSILLISSELPELINMSDRIIVIRSGQIAGEIERSNATEEAIMRLMATG